MILSMEKIADTRKAYTKGALSSGDLAADPIIQFEQWYHDAEREAGISEPNAMSLATATRQGQPSVRMVLMKGFGKDGFIFYTNYTSRKSQEIINNPQAALNFWWQPLERQVRIEGNIEKTSEELSGSYFNSRPRGSQLSAWASPQSQEIKEHYLAEKRAEIEKKFADSDTIPLPPHWGGFLLQPAVIEFWQGRNDRYHDRFRYTKSDQVGWTVKRLAP